MQFLSIIALLAATVSAATVSIEPRLQGPCPDHMNQLSNLPWTCCVYSYTYDQCCQMSTPLNGLSDMGFRTCEQFVKDGGNSF